MILIALLIIKTFFVRTKRSFVILYLFVNVYMNNSLLSSLYRHITVTMFSLENNRYMSYEPILFSLIKRSFNSFFSFISFISPDPTINILDHIHIIYLVSNKRNVNHKLRKFKYLKIEKYNIKKKKINNSSKKDFLVNYFYNDN